MNFKRLLTCAALALAALPATASAQNAVTPPSGDHYLDLLPVNDETQRIDYNRPFGFTADTSAYTVQPDMYAPPESGGPAEPTVCTNSNGVRSEYGNTIWSAFYADRWGVMRISTAGPFDAIIGIVPFNSLRDVAPILQAGACFDELGGFREEAQGLVSPGQWYAVQVGGTGNPQGGQVQVSYELAPPPNAEGRAFLFWDNGGRRITNLYVNNVPRGHRIELRCTKGACKKKNINVRTKPALNKLLTEPFSADAVGDVSANRAKGRAVSDSPGAAFRPLATTAAKRVKILKNKSVKPGARITLRITQTGFIGRYYRWKVKRGSITAATTRCMNPGSKKPRRRCSG